MIAPLVEDAGQIGAMKGLFREGLQKTAQF